MAGWGGFSEEDLHRLKKDSEPQRIRAEEKPENIRKANISLNPGTKRTKPREKIRSKTSAPKKNTTEKGNTSLVEKEKGLKTVDNFLEFEAENSRPECERNMDQELGTNTESQKKMELGDNSEENVPEIIIEPERIQAIELSALEKMQQQQKEIEDQNKIKKAALQQTIKTRFKKTRAEAHVLKIVQQELAHLDSLLSADVEILRNTIEETTRDYHCAMKRYEQAEAEFVAAKIELHRKSEKKEQLTEHLYAIIQQNEQRKAKKLEELMEKLNLSEDEIQADRNNQLEHRESEKSSINEMESRAENLKMKDKKEEIGECGVDVNEVGEVENGTEKGKTEMQDTRNEN